MIITRFANRLLRRSRRRIGPSTLRPGLERFEHDGSEREWAQIMMYCHVMNETREVPGDIAEFGVASGASFKAFVRINGLLNKLRPHPNAKKKVFGFDVFSGLPEIDLQKDLPANTEIRPRDMTKGGFASRSTLPALKQFVDDNENCRLYEGLFEDSLPLFLDENRHASFSLIHIDCDIYSSTKQVLELLIDRLNVGGIILFDEVFHENYPGETAAFWDVYNGLSGDNRKLTLEFRRVESMPWKWYAVRTG